MGDIVDPTGAALVRRLQRFADRDGTSPSAMAVRELADALAALSGLLNDGQARELLAGERLHAPHPSVG